MKPRLTILLAVACLIFSVCGATVSAQATVSTRVQGNGNEPTPFMRLLALRAPVKQFTQWAISENDLADNPGLNGADLKSVERAIMNGTLDEMSVSMPVYDLKDVDWSDREAPLKGSICEDFPGTFKIEYSDGLPVKFTLDEDDFSELLESGCTMDAFDIGMDHFTMDYYKSGMPSCLKGKRMDFFGGDDYEIRYSGYRYDEKGNWTRRKKTTKFDSMIEYRSYVY